MRPSSITKSQRGSTCIEVAIIVSLLAIVCIASLTVVGGATSAYFTDAARKMQFGAGTIVHDDF